MLTTLGEGKGVLGDDGGIEIREVERLVTGVEKPLIGVGSIPEPDWKVLQLISLKLLDGEEPYRPGPFALTLPWYWFLCWATTTRVSITESNYNSLRVTPILHYNLTDPPLKVTTSQLYNYSMIFSMIDPIRTSIQHKSPLFLTRLSYTYKLKYWQCEKHRFTDD